MRFRDILKHIVKKEKSLEACCKREKRIYDKENKERIKNSGKDIIFLKLSIPLSDAGRFTPSVHRNRFFKYFGHNPKVIARLDDKNYWTIIGQKSLSIESNLSFHDKCFFICLHEQIKSGHILLKETGKTATLEVNRYQERTPEERLETVIENKIQKYTPDASDDARHALSKLFKDTKSFRYGFENEHIILSSDDRNRYLLLPAFMMISADDAGVYYHALFFCGISCAENGVIQLVMFTKEGGFTFRDKVVDLSSAHVLCGEKEISNHPCYRKSNNYNPIILPSRLEMFVSYFDAFSYHPDDSTHTIYHAFSYQCDVMALKSFMGLSCSDYAFSVFSHNVLSHGFSISCTRMIRKKIIAFLPDDIKRAIAVSCYNHIFLSSYNDIVGRPYEERRNIIQALTCYPLLGKIIIDKKSLQDKIASGLSFEKEFLKENPKAKNIVRHLARRYPCVVGGGFRQYIINVLCGVGNESVYDIPVDIMQHGRKKDFALLSDALSKGPELYGKNAQSFLRETLKKKRILVNIEEFTTDFYRMFNMQLHNNMAHYLFSQDGDCHRLIAQYRRWELGAEQRQRDLREGQHDLLSSLKDIRLKIQDSVNTPTEWSALSENTSIDNVSITVLNNSEDLRTEGERMSHCVSGYSISCAHYSSHILHLENGVHHSTAELSLRLIDGHYNLVIIQHYGVENQIPEEVLSKALQKYVASLNIKENQKHFAKLKQNCDESLFLWQVAMSEHRKEFNELLWNVYRPYFDKTFQIMSFEEFRDYAFKSNIYFKSDDLYPLADIE